MKFRSQIHKIITEICNKHNIKIESFSDDWNFRLTKNNISYYISGYQFPLDNAPIRLIVDDKAAVSSILKEKKIKCFEHIFFMTKNFNIDIGEKMLKKYKKIVLKPNNGTGGRNVFLITTKNELENAINKLAIYNCICVSPYVEYENEFRAILLKNKVQLIYKKERPFIIGDGINTINYFANKINIIPDEAIDLNTIPAKGKKILLNWKHNLQHGAKAIIVDDEKIKKIIEKITILASKIININFCSIDVAKIKNNYMIVEINGGVMMEKFSSQTTNNYNIAKNIYKKAILLSFANIIKE